MSSSDTQNLPKDIANSNMALVIVPLIIGAAIVISAVVMWGAHERKLQIAETTRVEEEIRADLRQAFRRLRDNRPDQALAIVREIENKLQQLKSQWVTDYLDIKAARCLMEGEALIRLDPVNNAQEAETEYNDALALMTHASGQFWLYGMMGRARARLQTGDYAGAESDLTLLLDRNPSFGAAYFWRSRARNRQDNPQGALADEQKARSLDFWPPLRTVVMSPEDPRIMEIFPEEN